MSKYTGPRLRIVRRFGQLPGLTAKIPSNKKTPGQHGQMADKQKRSAISEYKIRLFEKQKLKYNYGLTERQLLNYVKKARKKKGSTGFFLMQMLEMRLDTTIFRLNLAPTIPAARQFVNHGHILINNKKVNIPSFQCHPQDIISLQNRKTSSDLALKNLATPRFASLPSHIDFDSQKFCAHIKDFVDKKDLSFKVNDLLIVEYYSRIA